MFRKCPPEIKAKVPARLKVFQANKYTAILNNHALIGKLQGLRSINISGDYRIIFEESGEDVVLVMIGTHSQLYK